MAVAAAAANNLPFGNYKSHSVPFSKKKHRMAFFNKEIFLTNGTTVRIRNRKEKGGEAHENGNNP